MPSSLAELEAGPAAELATEARPACPLCGSPGERAHTGLRDRLFGVPGAWGFRRCGAAGCGLLWLDPAPLAAELPKAYLDYYTHGPAAEPTGRASRARRGYAALVRGYQGLRWRRPDVRPRERLLGALLFLHPGRRADADFDAMYLAGGAGGRLLDVGCGSGRVLRTLALMGWSVRGIDFDPAAVRAARARGFEASAGGLAEHRFPAGSFDALTASHVLEHLPEPVPFLRECARVLAPGGQLVVVTPNADSLGHRTFGGAWRGLEPPRHLQVFTAPALRRAARDAGLEDCEVRVTIRNARGVYLASQGLRAAEAAGAAGATPARPGLKAELWQMREWAATLVHPELGEELVLVARRSKA